jgi:hypothetical protein
LNPHWWFPFFSVACFSTFAGADDRANYNRRSAERYIEMFERADVNRDNAVSRTEAHGTIELEANFNDVDFDRDDRITRVELERYIEAAFQ